MMYLTLSYVSVVPFKILSFCPDIFIATSFPFLERIFFFVAVALLRIVTLLHLIININMGKIVKVHWAKFGR